MPVNLSIKNAPDEVVDRLRARAARHHRSLQGELLAIVKDALPEPPRGAVHQTQLNLPHHGSPMSRCDAHLN